MPSRKRWPVPLNPAALPVPGRSIVHRSAAIMHCVDAEPVSGFRQSPLRWTFELFNSRPVAWRPDGALAELCRMREIGDRGVCVGREFPGLFANLPSGGGGRGRCGRVRSLGRGRDWMGGRNGPSVPSKDRGLGGLGLLWGLVSGLVGGCGRPPLPFSLKSISKIRRRRAVNGVISLS